MLFVRGSHHSYSRDRCRCIVRSAVEHVCALHARDRCPRKRYLWMLHALSACIKKTGGSLDTFNYKKYYSVKVKHDLANTYSMTTWSVDQIPASVIQRFLTERSYVVGLAALVCPCCLQAWAARLRSAPK